MELQNLKKHYLQPLEPVSIKKKWERRGRKRLTTLPAKNFEELLNTIVLPKWTEILKNKTKREGEPLGQVTEEYLWIKILRDMRDFFRIIFKSRFHRSEKRDDSNRDVLVNIFLQELGFCGINSIDYLPVYDFLYKAHYKARNTDNGRHFKEAINCSPMRIYYYYSESSRTKFMTDDLCSRLLYFFVSNFSQIYLDWIQTNLKKSVEMVMNSIIQNLRS